MAALSDEVKQFIVQALACYDSPSQVAEDVIANFGTQVPRQQVETYDPSRRAGRALSVKWRALFEATRTQWRKELAEIPIANRVTRLRALNRLAVLAERKGNCGLALEILEQAAKEVGGMYERRPGACPAVEANVDRPAPMRAITAAEYMLANPGHEAMADRSFDR
ncbi:MAG TPA: DUF2280 domain-containing protein [Burkholderiaceae bacterium]|jgi:hypothetical protein